MVNECSCHGPNFLIATDGCGKAAANPDDPRCCQEPNKYPKCVTPTNGYGSNIMCGDTKIGFWGVGPEGELAARGNCDYATRIGRYGICEKSDAKSLCSPPPPEQQGPILTPTPTPAPSVLYSCNNYQCKEDPNGSYKTLTGCESACKSEPYSCDKPTGHCYLDPKGKSKSLHECNSTCKPKYNCHINDDGTTECLIAKNGKFSSLVECQKSCKSKYMCDKDLLNQPTCRIAPKTSYSSAPFTSLESCQTQCQAKYSCDPKTNICRMDDKGTFDLQSCQQQCKPRYSCDTKNYVCAMDPMGKYSSSEDCTNECRPPLIIPKETITQAAFNEEIAQTETLKGSLNSSDTRFNSVNIQYIAYIILSVFIVGLIFYYMTNRTDNLLGTIVAIFAAGLLIYMIGMYVYKHYSPDTSTFRF